jgi:catechol 2,3-dioxygenase-like lactoylglutathione lyase family enzyme
VHQFRYLDAFATVTVRDLAAAERWYGDALGFRVIARGVDEGFLHVRRAPGQDLILHERRSLGDRGAGPAGLTLNFAVDSSLDSIAQQAAAVDPERVETRVAPDGSREVWITDPDGHELAFFERITPRARAGRMAAQGG